MGRRRQGQQRFGRKAGLVSRAEHRPGQPGLQRLHPKAHRIAAPGQRVQHRAHTAALGKAGGLGAAGNHHTVCKQAACGLQGVVQKGPCAKFGQQLAAPKAPPQPRGHDHAAHLRGRRIQIQHQRIRPAELPLQKRQLLLAHSRRHALLGKQCVQRSGIAFAAALQKADLIQQHKLALGRCRLPHCARRLAQAALKRLHALLGQRRRRLPHGPDLNLRFSPRPGQPHAFSGHKGTADAGGAHRQGQGAKRRGFADAPPAREQQVALTAGQKNIPDRAGRQPAHRLLCRLHTAAKTPFPVGSAGCRRPPCRRCAGR